MSKKNKKYQNQVPVGLITLADPTSRISEQFKTLRTNIQFSIVDKKLKTLVVTSAAPNSGKTTVAANLATTFAMQGLKVLLCECDLRRPTIHKVFQVPNGKGLTNILTDPSLNIEDCFVKTSQEGLSLLTAGPIPPNPAELLGSNRMLLLESILEERFDLVIFDTPPLLGFTDGQVMAGRADGTIFVIHHGVSTKEDVTKSSEILKMVDANVLGAVYNRVPADEQDNSYYYYYSEDK